MKYAFIEDYSGELPVGMMCRVLGGSKSGYYGWRSRPEPERLKRKREVMARIEQIHRNSKVRYGAPRVYHTLLTQGVKVTRSTLSRWMQEAGFRAKTKRRFRVITKDSKHNRPIAPNILDRNFEPRALGEVLTSDITYIPTTEGCLYPALTLGLGTRKVAGLFKAWSHSPFRQGVAVRLKSLSQPVGGT